jgi:hypothetical protein
MAINIIALYNIVIKLMDYGMKSFPSVYLGFLRNLEDEGVKEFIIVWFLYFFVGIIIHLILRNFSYFENFNSIQWRLILTFVSKWLIFLCIFIIIFYKEICENPPIPSYKSPTHL